MSKDKKGAGLRCSRMPGEVFDSESSANDMRVTRQMNVARGGMVQVNYVVKLCRCGRYHLMPEDHFKRWDESRRAAQREKKRNA